MDIVNDPQLNEPGIDSAGQNEWVEKREVLDRYRQLLAKDPRNVTLLNEVGAAAEEAGEMDRARWAYKRAIRLDPGYAPSYLRLGLLFKEEGRTGPATEALQAYMQRAGDGANMTMAQDALVDLVGQDQADLSQICDESPACSKLNRAWEDLGLTPAEALMLLDPDSSSGREMMQYTLLDLVARGVLEADDRTRVGRGEQFGELDLAPHEAMFAKYFSRISDYVDVDKLVRAALAEMDDRDDDFKAYYVRQSLIEKGFLESETRRVMGLLPVQQVVLSSEGVRARNQLKRLLKETDVQMARSLTTNPGQANAYLDKGGPALLLLDRYPANNFQEWHQMLTRMGFGPAIQRLRTKARGSEFGAYVDDIFKVLLGK